MPRKSSRKQGGRPWRTAAVLSTALAIGLWLPGRLSVAGTPSLGYRIFFLGAAGESFKQGDYLLFRKHLDHAGTDLLLKMVGCGPGERLTVSGDEYFCNERFLGRALEQDSQGKPLPRFIYNGIIPAGSLFMIGRHERSYDSRYFGFIQTASIINKAYPLW